MLHEALDACEVLALLLVIHHERHFARVDFLSPRPLMYAYHGESNGPGGVADGRLQVVVVGSFEVPLLIVEYDRRKLSQNVRVHFPVLAMTEEGLYVGN